MGESTMDQMAESSFQDEQYQFVRITDSLLQLYAPDQPDEVEVDIMFFHGLELRSGSKNQLLTWRSGDDPQQLWPQVWLPQEYPKARITVVSYDASINTTATEGRVDLYLIREALFQESRISYREQGRHCPVILVGHSFGGLVIKELCLQAHRKKEMNDVNAFIDRIGGIFFYSTPHSGMDGEVFGELVKGCSKLKAADKPLLSANEPLLSFAKMLSTNAVRVHHEFCSIQREYSWKIYGLGETTPVEGTSGVLVREASCRFGDEFFAVAGRDHFSICRPQSKECSSYQHLVELVRTVCEKQKMRRREHVKMETVGIDSLVINILQQHVPKKIYLGFFGMGGVDKTTVAKKVFEEIADRFEYTWLVEDFKFITGDKEEVKNIVGSRIHHHGRPICAVKGEPFEVVWSKVAGKRLLMLLDDIASEEHIEFLESIAKDVDMEHSRFIVTSRDERLLRLMDQGGQAYLCEIPFLSNEDAMQLFCKYSLSVDEEPASWMKDITTEIVKGCGGLPLTLEVMGKYLHRIRKESIWKELPRALRKAEALPPLERVWAKLRVSYDALQEEKNVFLDLACAFIRDEYFTDERAERILSARCISVSNVLQSLADKSLLKIKPYGYTKEWCSYFQMHEHLRSMGEKIAKEEGRIYLNHKLSTSVEEIQNILSDRSFCQNIVSFKFSCNSRTLSASEVCAGGHRCVLSTIRRALPQMKSLLYLDLDLRLVACEGTCLLSGLPLPANGVLVSLRGSRTWPKSEHATVELQKGPNAIGRLSQLRKLNPLYLARMIRTRFFEGAIGGHKSPNAIGQLSHLRELNLWYLGCEELPDAIGNLKDLLHMRILYCDKLRQLPKKFGNLGKLEYLCLVKLESLQQLPLSIGNLANMMELEVLHAGLVDLPETFGKLTNLRRLSLLGCDSLQKLPMTFGNLSKLSYLALICVNLERLPETFGNLSSLQYLSMSLPDDAVSELPETFADLSNLEHLEITGLQRFCPLIGKLSKLKSLNFGDYYGSLLSVTSNEFFFFARNISYSELIRLEDIRLTEEYDSCLEEVRKLFCNPSGSSRCTVKLYSSLK